jgi:hypothetical protein
VPPKNEKDKAWNHFEVVVKIVFANCKKNIKGGGVHRLKENSYGVQWKVRTCLAVGVNITQTMMESIEEYQVEWAK